MSRITRWLIVAVLLASLAVVLFPRRVERPFAVGTSLPPGKVPPQLAMTWDSVALVAPDGSLWAWGGSQFGLQCVFSNMTETPVPFRVGHDSDWSRVTLGIHFITAIKQDGSIWGWGSNWEGALASAPSNRVDQPWRLDEANDWMDVRAGAGHVMALKRDQSLWIWGQNIHGQIGDGTTNTCRKPKKVMTRSKWKSVSPSFFNSYGIADDGTLWGWGFSFQGRTAGSDNLIPMELLPGSKWKSISTGDYTLAAVQNDGTLWVGGQNLSRLANAKVGGAGTNVLIQIGNSTNWVDVWAGQSGFIARQQDGSWWANNSDPAILLGDSTDGAEDGSGLRRFKDDFNPWVVSVGMGTTAFLSQDGVLWTAGNRLGETRTGGLSARMKDLISRLIGSPRGNQTRPIIDRRPRAVWQLPAAGDGKAER